MYERLTSSIQSSLRIFSNLRSKRYHELVFALFKPLLFHLVDQRANFGVKNGGDAMEKTLACHMSIEREEVHFSGVSGQISMVWTREKVI